MHTAIAIIVKTDDLSKALLRLEYHQVLYNSKNIINISEIKV